MKLFILPRNVVQNHKSRSVPTPIKVCSRHLEKVQMRNCSKTVTPLETRAKLRNDTNDEHVNATFYK